MHERRSYYVIPQNKLGQDIYIRTTEYRSSDVTLLSSGDDRSIKVPASRDLLDSHLKGRSVRLYRLMVTAIIANAEVLSSAFDFVWFVLNEQVFLFVAFAFVCFLITC